MKYNTPFYYVLLFCTLLWCALILLPGFIVSASPATQTIAAFFSLICHQIDSRSLHLNGEALSVCTRCSAIYFGFLLAVVCAPFFHIAELKNQRLGWMAALFPMAVDVLLSLTGIHPSTTATRIATGGFFGIVAGRILLPLVLSIVFEKKNRASHFFEVVNESKAG